ncbi:MAG: cytochrome c biogenesis protein CcsA [Hylemonella sp.]|nr:cytochrome c biogenesis protein CcsA [Hylemonella sp.]
MILTSASTAGIALAVLAALAYAALAWRLSPVAAWRTVVLAWVLHGLLLGWSLLGDTPRFGFAPALSVTVWLVAAIYAVEIQLYPQLQTRWALSVLGTGAVLLALLFPGQALQASASAWLPLHLALGIASYGLFAVAVVHALLMLRAEERIRRATDPQSGLPLLTLERLTFRFVTAGFVLLSATLLAGLLFDELLYGAAWNWSHKIVFSMLSWAVFAILLIGRARFGWRGWRAARLLFTGAGLLLLAYVGSRFVLEIVLGRSTS